MLQTLKIPLGSMILSGLALALFLGGCRGDSKVRPMVSGYDRAGQLQKCQGLADDESCPERANTLSDRCVGDGKEVVYCMGCVPLCTFLPDEDAGGEPAI
jgi:hypothetical protein